jgi:hypothetical protein
MQQSEQSPRWRAIMRDTGLVVAEGQTLRECSEAALQACPWGGHSTPSGPCPVCSPPAGAVAPYYIEQVRA